MTTHKGTILITRHNDKLLALLIQDNQILAAQVIKSTEYAVGNIYVGKIQSISQNIGAAFLDLGGGYLTFLPLAEAQTAQAAQIQEIMDKIDALHPGDGE